MKLLKILSADDGGGVFVNEITFIKCWKSNGINVDAIIIGEGESINEYKKNVDNFIQLPSLKLLTTNYKIFNFIINNIKSLIYAIQHVSKLKAIYDVKYDATIYRRSHFIFLAGILSYHNKTNVFWFMAGSLRNCLESYFYKIIVGLFKIIPIGNSKYTIRSLRSKHSIFVYPGFSSERLKKSETIVTLRSKLGIKASDKVFGIASRFEYRKGIHLVIQSFEEILKLHNNIHLIIAGGPIDNDYGRMCQSYVISNNKIHFIGKIDEIGTFFDSIDVFINSYIGAEAFGIGIAEALGASKPVLAHYRGGPSEMIVHGENGWLVCRPTVKYFSMAIQEALDDYVHWTNFGQVSKQKSRLFHSEVNASVFLEIIRSHSKNI